MRNRREGLKPSEDARLMALSGTPSPVGIHFLTEAGTAFLTSRLGSGAFGCDGSRGSIGIGAGDDGVIDTCQRAAPKVGKVEPCPSL